jgi:signal recognition particle subunit SRP54
MFEKLNDTFSGLFRKLSGNDAISEKNVAEAMQDVRTALLDADVHLDVVNAFSASVMQDAIGRQVTKTLNPAQEMIGIVHRRLVEFLGGTLEDDASQKAELAQTGLPIPLPKPMNNEGLIVRAASGPTVIMMTGLQGSGKTTTCGKLAAYLKKRGRSVMLAACDLQRPAAVEQLRTICTQVSEDHAGSAAVVFYAEADKCAEYGKAVGVAVQVAQRALQEAKKQGIDTLIIDTAGRLHINDELMGELGQVQKATSPHHVFLVVDAMTGQDAVNSAKAFHSRLTVDGVILTKFDSDTRGGAAISVKHVTGAPIKFVGVGEKIEALEEFHPERVAGRILGMGDVVSLVEKAQQEMNDDDAKTLQDRMMRGEMSMDDFLKQLKTLRRMGPLKSLLGLLPGVGSMLKDVNIEDKQLDRVEAMISSMNRQERKSPSVMNNSRRKRVANGSGATMDEVGRLTKQFDMVSKMTREMAGMSAMDRAKMATNMRADDPAQAMGAMRGMMGRGSSFTPSVKAGFKKRKK